MLVEKRYFFCFNWGYKYWGLVFVKKKGCGKDFKMLVEIMKGYIL